MDDVEYILRIILRARDEMATVLAKARREIRGFSKDANTMNSSLTNLNQAMKNFDTNLEGITQKLNAWRTTLRDTDRDGKALAKTFDTVGKNAETSSRKVGQSVKAQDELNKAANRLRSEYEKLGKVEQDNDQKRAFAALKYKDIARSLENLAKKVHDPDLGTFWTKWARDAKSAADEIDGVTKAEKDHNAALAKTRDTQADLINQANKRRDQYREIQAMEQKTDKDRAFAAARLKQLGTELDRISQKIDDASTQRLYFNWAEDAKRGSKEITDASTAVRLESERLTRQLEQDSALQERIARVNQRSAVVRARVARGGRDRGDVAELRRIAAEQDSIARGFAIGTEEARHFNREAEHTREVLRGVSRESNRTGVATKKLSEHFHGMGDSVAGFDNQLRGLGILAAVVSIQQLISAAIALGGELVSLAGSAVMAGGALGGILAAGAAQALPVIGLLAGALSRAKGVLDAFKQSQMLQKAQFSDAEKGAQKQIDKTSQLANAQDAAAAANDNLAESRKALTEAQKEGTDQLQDLILAEKQAALAAKGAALDVKSAQEALRLAISGGADQLEIDQKRQALAEAKLGQQRAGIGAKRATGERAAAGGDIGNLPNVQAAEKAVAQAERSVQRTGRALDVAADKTDRLASSTMTAQANLNFLLSQMSPAERKLYTAFQGLYTNYKKIFSGTKKDDGIYGTIIDSFTRAVEEANKIIQMPKVVASLTKLSGVIGDNIDKVVQAVADPTVMNQLIGIIDAASENLGPVVDIIIDLGKAFLNIAETANPAFQKLLEYLGPIVDKFLALTDDKGKMEDFFLSGEEHLESWLNLVLAIIGLFAALTGASAGSGKKSIDDLTESVKGWTDWIDEHHDQVVAFFEDARKAAYAIGDVLANLAVALGTSFSAERVEHFADILNKAVIPALVGVIDTIGKAVDWISRFVDTPVGSQITKWLIGFFLLSKIASSVTGVFGIFSKIIGGMIGGVEKAVHLFRNFGKYVDNVTKAFSKGWLAIQRFHAMLRITAIFMETHAPLIGRAMTLMLGPWGLLIAAVIIGIVLLLKHFGKLDDIWDAIKKAAAGFLEDIKPAVEALQEALSGLGIKIDSLQDVLKFLEKGGKILADFISTYLISYIQGLFKILAGVATFLIRTLAGLIKILHGLADILIGIFTLDGDQIKKGFKGIVDGIIDIFWGIVDGLKLALEGVVKIMLAPFKAAWDAIKGFFGVKSPSTKAKELGHDIIEGIKDGLKGLFRALTWPYRRAWKAVNDFFDGKPQKLAESIMDELVSRMRVLWRRVRNAAKFIWEKFKDGFDAAKNFGGSIINAIIDGIKNLPSALLEAIKNIGNDLLEVGKAIGGKIVEGIKSVAGSIKDFFGGGDDDKKKPAAQKPAAGQPAVKFDIGVGAIPFGAKDLKDAQNIYGDFWRELRKTARVSTDYIQRQFREMRIATTNSSDKMYVAIRGSLRDIQNSFKVRGGAAARNWEKTWLDFQKTAYEGLNYIGHETNKALKGFGAKSINFGLSVPTGGGKGGEEKAVGGWIGNKGERGRDVIPAMLGRGEAVLNWAHQRVVEPALQKAYGFGLEGLFGHTRAFHAMPVINGRRGFAEGGSTDTRLARLIAAANRVDAMHLPYVWGGGHTQPAAIGSGMDCSGSVSYVVQQAGYKVPTVTSGNMPSWGFQSGGDGATVFYNPEHTFMRIGQKYFGTTGFGHPGWTGAGWFTQAPSASYLSGFSQIHLPGITDVGGFAVGVGGEIAKLIVKGAKGAAKTLMQKAFDLVVPAANKHIGEQSSQSSAGPGQWGDAKTVPAGAENIFRFFREHGFTDEQAAGWIGNLTQESGLNPGIIQPGGEGHGLAQWGHGRFDALVSFAKSHGTGDWRDLGTQLEFILYELAGSERAAGSAIRAARTVQEAVDAIGLKYERFGIAGNRSAPAEAALRQFGGKFAEGGIVPGGEGTPTPILAHAGEWVLNKTQQARAAMLAGLSPSGLKAMLGFWGPSDTAQGGTGTIGKGRPTVKSITSRATKDLTDDLFQNVAQSLSDLTDLSKGMRQISKLTKKVRPVLDLIELSTKEGGFLDALRASIERQFARTSLRLRRAQLTVGRGRVVRDVQSEVATAEDALTEARRQRGPLTDERKQISDTLKKVTERQKRAKPGSKLAKDLEAREIELRNRLTDANERVMTNTEEIFQAQEAVAEARKEAAQKLVEDTKKRYSRLLAANELAKRAASALGDSDLIIRLSKAESDILTNQANDLEAQIANLEKVGDTEGAADLRAEVADLRMKVFEMAQQALRDAADAIGTAATRERSRLDLFGRAADALGIVGNAIQAAIPGVPGAVGTGLGAMSRAQVAQGRIGAAVTERAGYVGLLGQAQAAGNIGLSQELIDKINDLTVQIMENTKAARDANIAATQEEFDYLTSINSLKTQLVTATGAVSGLTDNVELERLARERGEYLRLRGIELEAQWRDALAEGDVKSARDLEKALLENQIAVQDNTKAVNEISGQGNAPSSFTSTAWQYFRTALLTGTGGLMPQYTPPVMADVSSIGGGGGMSSSSTVNGASIVNNFEINEVGQPIDTTKLASTVVFAQSTAQ